MFIGKEGSPGNRLHLIVGDYNDRIRQGQETNASARQALFLDTLENPILSCPYARTMLIVRMGSEVTA